MKSELKVKLVAFIITAVIVTSGVLKNNILIDKQKVIETNQVLAMESYNTYDINLDLDVFILNNQEVFDFYTNMFGISLDDLKENIIKDNDGRLNYNDLGNTSNTYESLDKNLIDYLFKLKSINPTIFNQEYENANNYTKDYIYGLIKYYSNIYNNVNFNVLSSIAYIESGNLNARYMMSCNNIFGGMSRSGLLKYPNIEYGVLSYVKMMSERYYAKGLDTVEKIAIRYNNGSTSWIYNVNSKLSVFDSFDNITNISELVSLK